MSTCDAKAICERLTALLPEVKGGSLAFWGNWFGRPMDNMHRVVRCIAVGDSLRLGFDKGEVLTVDSPVGFSISKDTFWINDAALVRWEWFYYGRPRTPANRCHQEFARTANGIHAKTNADWCGPSLNPEVGARAVEIH